MNSLYPGMGRPRKATLGQAAVYPGVVVWLGARQLAVRSDSQETPGRSTVGAHKAWGFPSNRGTRTRLATVDESGWI